MAATLTAMCDPANVAADGTCSSVVWVEQPGIFPPLSVADGSVIGVAIMATLATVWGIRVAISQLRG